MVDDAEFAKLNARVALLERQVEFLLAHSNLRYVDGAVSMPYPDVAELKRRGDLIGAIKAYRSHTNASLAEAKTFVENMAV
jgi:ribosomal protein L7/L12